VAGSFVIFAILSPDRSEGQCYLEYTDVIGCPELLSGPTGIGCVTLFRFYGLQVCVSGGGGVGGGGGGIFNYSDPAVQNDRCAALQDPAIHHLDPRVLFPRTPIDGRTTFGEWCVANTINGHICTMCECQKCCEQVVPSDPKFQRMKDDCMTGPCEEAFSQTIGRRTVHCSW
jgi:hypothetical protein